MSGLKNVHLFKKMLEHCSHKRIRRVVFENKTEASAFAKAGTASLHRSEAYHELRSKTRSIHELVLAITSEIKEHTANIEISAVFSVYTLSGLVEKFLAVDTNVSMLCGHGVNIDNFRKLHELAKDLPLFKHKMVLSEWGTAAKNEDVGFYRKLPCTNLISAAFRFPEIDGYVKSTPEAICKFYGGHAIELDAKFGSVSLPCGQLCALQMLVESRNVTNKLHFVDNHALDKKRDLYTWLERRREIIKKSINRDIEHNLDDAIAKTRERGVAEVGATQYLVLNHFRTQCTMDQEVLDYINEVCETD